jgi:hypothetical protein
MGTITVSPQEWQLVKFDSAEIETVASRLAGQLEIDRDIAIEVDEATPFGRVEVASIEPTIVLKLEGGAIEDPKRPRHLSDRVCADVLGRILHRVKDRLDPAFGDAPADADLTLQQSTAWDAYSVGRMARLGYPVQRQRRLYHFRNRHGFTDVADAAFERLWNGEGLTWADIQGACDECAQERAAV